MSWKRWLFYHQLAWRDITRLWPTTHHQVVIIAGICLPILLLLGLKRGHVAELRKELLTSPSGRQIVFWSAQGGALLDPTVVERLAEDNAQIDVIIPETQRIVEIDPPSFLGVSDASNLVTLFSTREGDPILQQYAADVLRPQQMAIVLAEHVANRLRVRRGDHVTLHLRRRRESVDEKHSVDVEIAAVVPSASEESQTGYAHLWLLSAIEHYVRGYPVAELKLPAIENLRARDDYFSYLLFCQKGAQTDLQPDDVSFFADRGIDCEEIVDSHEKCLYGVLDSERVEELRVYRLQQRSSSEQSLQPMRQSPLFITENTQAVDDFVLRWNTPLEVTWGDGKHNVVGLSLPTVTQTGGWIREYLRSPAVGFGFEESLTDPFQMQVLGTLTATLEASALTMEDGTTVPIDVVAGLESPADAIPETPAAQGSSENSSALPRFSETLIVPANLLAWMHGQILGTAQFDAQGRTFAPMSEPQVFDKARLYTRTIDDVPRAVEYLAERRYAVLSEGSRITEIQNQDRSLQVLVWVVAAGVLFFGTVTVISVLVDSTDRKRGTVGILRVMGMSRSGIFYVVVIRALSIGLLGEFLSTSLGLLFAWLLRNEITAASWSLVSQPISVVFVTSDVLAVFVGALVSAGTGALVPAWRAGTIDPFDAIVEGRFR